MRRLVFTEIILTGVLFAACNRSNRTRIGVVPKAVAHVFWQSVQAGAVAAAREGIPLTIFDSGINTEDYVSFVATNNYEAGVLAAKKLAEILGSQGKTAVVKMIPDSASTTQREKGFEDTLGKEFPDMQIVAEQFCMSNRAKALAVAENMLTGASRPRRHVRFGRAGHGRSCSSAEEPRPGWKDQVRRV